MAANDGTGSATGRQLRTRLGARLGARFRSDFLTGVEESEPNSGECGDDMKRSIAQKHCTHFTWHREHNNPQHNYLVENATLTFRDTPKYVEAQPFVVVRKSRNED